jgi:hypothetical protein
MARVRPACELLVSALVLACSSGSGGSSGTLYCSVEIAGAAQCSGYSNLTPDEQTAEQAACADEQGAVVGVCPDGYVGCCATSTAGYDLKQCYYAGTAATLEAACSGVWTGTTSDAGTTDAGSDAHASGIDAHASTIDSSTDGHASATDSSTDAPPTKPDGDASAAIAIVSLSSTATQLTSPASATPSDATSANIIAIVTDTSGLDAIAGGQLMGAGGLTYAAFGAASEKGTYTATIDWTTVNQTSALSFAPPGDSRVFTAKFFDNAGNTTTANISIELFCNPTATTGACDGTCTDFTSNESCGGCTTTCDAGAECINQACQAVALADCSTPSGGAETCASVCASSGKSCTASCTDNGMTGLAGIYGMAVSADCADALSPISSCTDDIAQFGTVQFACCCIQ